MERTFVMVKPDGVAKALVGTVIARLEGKGLKLAQMKMMNIDRSLAEEHYGEHKERPFFGELVDFITSGPVVAMEWTGPSAITAARQMMGATNPLEAGPGTIRGDFALEIGENIVHGSDGPESAERELGLFFG
ncbi:MAG: nucleoside-diphosphate kinase [Acidimicrobiia bacterium]|nr:nucleoside-diphosphate kinase [Acidimicrobiia bacterium]MBT8251198.1 nucleoside-diphosphate kinase [Acidimicrobiia bacterium]NND13170.1 nucleoside-diphosphate kinase [Acidimicrobiia bacterium]NNL29361.1 nucleoside-diphosphate kinase [Acidimicrobiia bacterium]